MGVKVVIFDFWGTIVENGMFPGPLHHVRKILGLERTPFPIYVSKLENAMMLKKFKDLFHAFENVCKDFNIKPEKKLLDELVAVWNKNKLLAKPFPETIAVLEKLSKKYKLALASNTDCFSVEQIIEKYDLKKYFKVIALSYKEGVLKTNPKMFEKILKKLKIKQDEALMIGDSLHSDVFGAKKAGIRGILVDRRGTREYEEKIADLEGIGKFLK